MYIFLSLKYSVSVYIKFKTYKSRFFRPTNVGDKTRIKRKKIIIKFRAMVTPREKDKGWDREQRHNSFKSDGNVLFL